MLELGLRVVLEPRLRCAHDKEIRHDIQIDQAHHENVVGDWQRQAAGLDHLVQLDEGSGLVWEGQSTEEMCDVVPVDLDGATQVAHGNGEVAQQLPSACDLDLAARFGEDERDLRAGEADPLVIVPGEELVGGSGDRCKLGLR